MADIIGFVCGGFYEEKINESRKFCSENNTRLSYLHLQNAEEKKALFIIFIPVCKRCVSFATKTILNVLSTFTCSDVAFLNVYIADEFSNVTQNQIVLCFFAISNFCVTTARNCKYLRHSDENTRRTFR